MSTGAFSFDENEFGDVPDDVTDETMEQMFEDPAEDAGEQTDPSLNDVDLRLAVADYYRAILSHSFFDLDTEAAQLVHHEISAFIRDRLEILLGLRIAKPKEIRQFDDAEVQVLKLMASKVLKKPSLMDSSAPKVNKMPTPQPAKAEAPKQLPMRPKPQVRNIAAPAVAPSTKPKAPAPKPQVAKPAQPAFNQAKKAQPLKKSQPQKGRQADEGSGAVHTYQKVDNNGVVVAEETLEEGAEIVENGRKYKVVANELGGLYKKDVTGQVGLTAQNFTTPDQLMVLSAQHAALSNRTAAQAMSAAPITAVAVGAALSSGD